jgi:hypothetical protein
MADNSSGWMDFAQRSRDDGGLGLAPHQAAGLVGNLQNESGSDLNPWGPTGDNGTAWGTAQWRGDRLDGLKQSAQASGLDYRTPEAQQAWMRREFDTTHNAAYKALQATTTPEEAANVVNRQYEISADRSGNRERSARALIDGPTAIETAMGRTRSTGSQPMAYAATDPNANGALNPAQPQGALTAGGSPVPQQNWADKLGQMLQDMAPGIAQDPDHAKALEAVAAGGRKVAQQGTWSQTPVDKTTGKAYLLNSLTGQRIPVQAGPGVPEKDPVQQAADIARVKSYSDYADTLAKNGADSRAALDTVGPIQAALQNPDVPQGPLGETRASANKMALLLPGATDSLRKTVSDTDVAVSGINKMVQEGRTLNGGMPGSLSDKDIVFLKQSQAGLNNTPEANQRIIDIYKQLHNRRVELDNARQAYVDDAEAHPLGLDNGFRKQINDKWAAENAARDKALSSGESAPARVAPKSFKTQSGVSWSIN